MKTYSKLLLTAIAIFLMSFACGEKVSPLMSKKVEKSNLIELAEDIKKDNIMSREDISFFLTALNDDKLEDITGKTVGEVIQSKKAEISNTLKNNLVAKANQRLLAEAIAYGTIKESLQNIKNEEGKIAQHRLALQYKNNTDKDIKSFTGAITMTFENEGKSYNTPAFRVSYGELKKGETKAFAKKIQASNKSMVTAAMLAQGKKTITFNAQKIEFADGTVYSILKEEKEAK